MDIYDLEKNYNKICTVEASNASVCEWSPDGKHILTATTSPRLRVDNGVRIWHVGGGLMYNEELQELYHVCWRPQSTITHPLTNPLTPIPIPHASALAYLGTVKTPSKPAGAYRPPGARGTLTPLAFKREDEGGAAYVSNGSLSLGSGVNGFGKPRKREVPGAEAASEDQSSRTAPGATPTSTADGDENLSKAALKNKKKREAKKAKEAADKVAGLAPNTDSAATATAPPTGPAEGRSPERRNRRGHERSRSKSNTDGPPRTRSQQGRQQPRSEPTTTTPARPSPSNGTPLPPRPSAPTPIAAAASSVPPETPDLTVTSPTGGGGGGVGSAQDKKIRALLKKLRAIDDLKMRRAGGEKLEGTQIRKMETEEGVRRELEALGWSD